MLVIITMFLPSWEHCHKVMSPCVYTKTMSCTGHTWYETPIASPAGHTYIYLLISVQLGSLLYISNSILSHSTHTVGTASNRNAAWGSKVDRWGVAYVSTILVCPGSADHYFWTGFKNFSPPNGRVVPILVANMPVKIRESCWGVPSKTNSFL